MNKDCFLLDESFVGRVWVGMKEAIEVWNLILEKCHPLALTNELVQRYFALKEKVELQRFDPIKHINLSSRLPGKADWRDDAPPLPKGPVRHQDDHFLLEIAAKGGAILITTDTQTRDDFNSPNTSKRYGVEALTIEEALRRLQLSDP